MPQFGADGLMLTPRDHYMYDEPQQHQQPAAQRAAGRHVGFSAQHPSAEQVGLHTSYIRVPAVNF